MKRLFQNIAKIVFNKYFIALAVFVFAMLTSEQHNLRKRFSNEKTISSLEREIIYFKEQNRKDSLKLEELKSDAESFEKFARERYKLRKPDEDVFIIVDE